MSTKPSRLSVALDFACAAITVMLSGYAADVMMDAASARKAKKARVAEPLPMGYIAVPESILCQFIGRGACVGLIPAVVRETGRPQQFVTGVLHGRFKNPAVAAALIEGISKRVGPAAACLITRADAPKSSSLTPVELEGFRPGGPYYGLMARVSRKLGVNSDAVAKVAHGRSKNARVLSALREEMTSGVGPSTVGAPRKKRVSQFSEEILAEMGKGIYRGAMARVGRDLRISTSSVCKVLRGHKHSPLIVAALKAEIARIDAEHAAKKGASL